MTIEHDQSGSRGRRAGEELIQLSRIERRAVTRHQQRAIGPPLEGLADACDRSMVRSAVVVGAHQRAGSGGDRPSAAVDAYD